MSTDIIVTTSDQMLPGDNLSKLEQKYLTISPPQVH